MSFEIPRIGISVTFIECPGFRARFVWPTWPTASPGLMHRGLVGRSAQEATSRR